MKFNGREAVNMDKKFKIYCLLRNWGWSVNDASHVFAEKTMAFESLYLKFFRPAYMTAA
jgi:hypothetical protein